MLSNSGFSATEGPNAVIPVMVAGTMGIRLANPVNLTVTPLTVFQAVNQGLTIEEVNDDPNSPVKASKICNGVIICHWKLL